MISDNMGGSYTKEVRRSYERSQLKRMEQEQLQSTARYSAAAHEKEFHRVLEENTPAPRIPTPNISLASVRKVGRINYG